MKCLLNIWGVMLYLRLTWVIGQAGMIEGLFIIGIANLVSDDYCINCYLSLEVRGKVLLWESEGEEKGKEEREGDREK